MAVEEETFERTFSVGPAAELVLSNIAGTVEIATWDEPEIRARGTKRPGGLVPWVSAEEGFRATRIEMEQQGSRVIVRTTREREGFWRFVQWLGGVAQVDYSVQVPRRCSVVVDLVSGRLSVRGVRGNVITRTVSADQRLQQLDGSLVASTVSGHVDAEECRGKMALRTVSGGIHAAQGQFASLSGRAVSGDMRVGTPLDPAGSYEFRSVSGSVRLELPRDTRCSAELQSISGSIRSELPGRVQETRRGHWQAEINGGGPRVRFQTVSGVLRLVESAAAAALPESVLQPAWPPADETPPRASEPSVADEEQRRDVDLDRESIMMMILEGVERGALTVEEAAAKLAELDSLTGEGEPAVDSADVKAEAPDVEADQAPPSEAEERGATDGR